MMILHAKKGCIPCMRTAQAVEGHKEVEVRIYDLSLDQEYEKWAKLRERLGFTISPVLETDEGVFCGIMSISGHLDLSIN